LSNFIIRLSSTLQGVVNCFVYFCSKEKEHAQYAVTKRTGQQGRKYILRFD